MFILGCHRLPVEKVRHHLLLAGIEGTIIFTNPQQFSLRCDPGLALGAAHCRRDPLGVRKRGHLTRGMCLPHQFPSIPALPQHHQKPTRPCRFLPRHTLNGKHDPMLSVESDGRARAPHARDHQTSSIQHPGRFTGGEPYSSMRLLCIPASPPRGLRLVCAWACEGASVLKLCGVVPTGRMTIHGETSHVIANPGLPRPCWMPQTGEMDQLLQLREVTQGR